MYLSRTSLQRKSMAVRIPSRADGIKLFLQDALQNQDSKEIKGCLQTGAQELLCFFGSFYIV